MRLDIKLAIMEETEQSKFNNKILINAEIETWSQRIQTRWDHRIEEAYENFRFAISHGHSEFHLMYSGGKDSTTVILKKIRTGL